MRSLFLFLARAHTRTHATPEQFLSNFTAVGLFLADYPRGRYRGAWPIDNHPQRVLTDASSYYRCVTWSPETFLVPSPSRNLAETRAYTNDTGNDVYTILDRLFQTLGRLINR